MIIRLDITNHKKVREILQPLQPDTAPLWGKMTAQQMVEHLVDQMRYTNGELEPYLDVPLEDALKRKQRAKENDGPMQRNVNFGDLPANEFSDLPSAINQLIIELELFDKHYEQPGVEEIHGGFGPMNHEEWLWWHGKHFAHHFEQFGLMEQAL